MSDQRAGQDDVGAIMKALTSLISCDDLPDPLPEDPMPLLLAWFEDARTSGAYDDYNAMTLATATPDGAPSARIVLCKAIEREPPALAFYTNHGSRKGHELAANPRAAALFHWTHHKRQVRIEGPVARTSDAESDAYFHSRPLLSQIASAASAQSTPLRARADLIKAAMRIAATAAISGRVERPAYWGGYRISIESVELWSARSGRLHDRAVWRRAGDDWSAQRLSC